MDTSEIIEHDAIIKEINETTYSADILAKAGCISCQLNKVCSVSDMEQKTIIVQKINDRDIKIGENVSVYISQSKGLKAVFLGYILPFLIVFTTLLIVHLITKNDGIAGLASIGILVPYYFILYLLKDKINKNYKFHLK